MALTDLARLFSGPTSPGSVMAGVRATPFLEQLEQALARPTPVPSPAASAAGLPARPAASPPK